MSGYIPENDYSEDSLQWDKLLSERKLKTNPYSKDKNGYNIEEVEKLQNEIVKDNNSAFAYFCANEFPYKQFRMQKVILDNKDPKYAFMFARHIPHADIKALQNLVVKSKKIKYITHFACFVESADHSILEKIIIDSNKVKYAHMYLKHVKQAKVSKFKQVILASGKPRYLFELAKHLNNSEDIRQIEDLIIALGSFTYIRLLAGKIKLANVEKLEQAVLDSGNNEEIKKFAKYVKKSRMRHFLLVV
jgi:hypothetical protein